MASETTDWDTDEAWLYERLARAGRRPTEDQVEAFCERVAIRVADGMAPSMARSMTFREQFGG